MTRRRGEQGALAILCLVALYVGLRRVQPTAIGASWTGPWRALRSQLGTTGPAALRVLAATTLNLAAGASALRVIRRRPFASVGEAALAGLAGASLLDLVALGLFASWRAFNLPVVLALHVLALHAGWLWGRPFVVRTQHRHSLPGPAWILFVVVWSAPVVLQLASPVVPFYDVLPNHVAPVEHLRVYEAHRTLATNPAADYGPSRLSIGYTALLGTISKLAGVPAVLATAAFALPLAVLLALAAYRFASSLFGVEAGFWALLVVPLTFTFMRLPDARTSVLVIPLLFEALRADERPLDRATSLGAALLIHPVIALFAIITLLAQLVADGVTSDAIDPEQLAALAGGGTLAIPQAMAMVGVDWPIWLVLPAIPLAVLVAWTVGRLRLRVAGVVPVAASIAAVLVLWRARELVERSLALVEPFVRDYPLITIGFLAALIVCGRRAIRFVGLALATTLAAEMIVTYLPASPNLLPSMRDEVAGKWMQSWAPLLFALSTAGALAALWRSDQWVRRAPVVAFAVCAVLPLRAGTASFERNEEHRIAEAVSMDLRKAERGAWENWPDWRYVLNGPRAALVDAVRREQASGRFGEHDELLHVAATYESWVSTPIAAFTGVTETNVSLDVARAGGHAAGGRLHALADLPALLKGPFRYLVYEPAGLSAETRASIDGGGWRRLFANDQAELFVR